MNWLKKEADGRVKVTVEVDGYTLDQLIKNSGVEIKNKTGFAEELARDIIDRYLDVEHFDNEDLANLAEGY